MKAMTAFGVTQLMPGLPDHLTLDLIAPKLPWRAFHVLSSVSRAWLHAIRSHEVYAARVRCNSTRTFAVIDLSTDGPIFRDRIPLYSFSDDSFLYLPPIPNSYQDMVGLCQFVPLDGKLYVLISLSKGFHLYVLDLSGLRQWKQLACLLEKRASAAFVCCAGKTKIFVLFDRIRSAVFDLNDNTWICIKPPQPSGFGHMLAAFGEKRVVRRGKLRIQNSNGRQLLDHFRIYDPVKDVWRVMYMIRDEGILAFMAGGKFHYITEHDIYLYDMDTNSWTHLISHSFAAFAPNDSARPMLRSVVGVEDELLVVVFWLEGYKTAIVSVLRSKGLRSKNNSLLWQEVEIPPMHYKSLSYPGLGLMSTIGL